MSQGYIVEEPLSQGAVVTRSRPYAVRVRGSRPSTSTGNMLVDGANFQWNSYQNWKRNHRVVGRAGTVNGRPIQMKKKAGSKLKAGPPAKKSRSLPGSSAVQQTSDAGGQMTTSRSRFRLGRNISSMGRLLKEVRANTHRTVFRFQGINALSLTRGYFWLRSSTEAAGATRYLPLNAFDLTSCLNFYNGTNKNAMPLTQMFATASIGAIDFATLQGTDPGGTASYIWQCESSPQTPNYAPVYPSEKSFLRWINIKLLLYGTKNWPTNYDVMLVRFTNRDLVPTPSGQTDYAPATGVSDLRTNFFQNLIKANTYNPIATTQRNIKGMKVLRRQTFSISDQDSGSVDTAPLAKQVNWFIRTNKACNYKTNAPILGSGVNIADNANYVQQTGVQVYPYTFPTSRLYLIIMATAWTDVVGAPATTVTPSYDLNIRVCHEKIN